MERLARGLKASGMLMFVTVFFFFSSALALCSDSRKPGGFVLFRDLHLPELKTENISGLSLS